jgi:signal transduction histidine kinase
MAVSPKPSWPVVRPASADPAVAGHRRGGGSRVRSMRAQLLAPVLVAMLGLGVLGTVQTAEAVSNARDADRARVLATTATATVRLTHELERELAETVALRQRGGRSGEQLVTAQRMRTDQALGRYRQVRAMALRNTPSLDTQFRIADPQLSKLDTARAQANASNQTDEVFHDIANALLGVADALPAQLRDPDLASAARQVAALAAVEHYCSLERDLLRGVFSRGSLQPGELIELARLGAAEEQREAEFARVATAAARDRYDETVAGPDVQKAGVLVNAVLSGDPAALKVDADGWYVVQSTMVRKVNLVGLSLSDRLDSLAADISVSASRRAWLTALGAVTVGLFALVTALVLAVRTSRRLRRLRAAALAVARRELPDAIGAVMAGAPPDRGPGQGSAAAATRRIAASDDEVGAVADAFSSVHRTALRLAGDQAELHVDVARMAEIFARRIRTLITRQLRLLDEFEREETDPDALSRLFALDQLAARLRRNGENLLVLAGGEPGRPMTGAFPLAAVVTAAASEIEDFHRVEAQPMDAAVVGPVVGDLVHLLAELLENAASFSPPDTPVRVDARHTIDGVVLGVHDSGIGLTEARLERVNGRLAQRTATLSSAAAGTMGLYVVARLAARHGIKVQLHATATGTVAYVLMPVSVLAPLDAVSVTRAGLVEAALGAMPTGRHGRLAMPATTPWFRPYQWSGGAGMAVAAHRSAEPDSPAPPRAPVPTQRSADPDETTPPRNGSTVTRPAIRAETAASLPRRNPGARYAPAPSVGATLRAPAHEPSAPVDPEVVRARLSALAEGVSAALRRSNSAGHPAGYSAGLSPNGRPTNAKRDR